jgi:hypothetical protein
MRPDIHQPYRRTWPELGQMQERRSPMSEEEWLRCPDGRALLAELYPIRSESSGSGLDRKLRLYLVACARQVWPALPHAARAIIDYAERLADGESFAPTRYHAIYDAAEHLLNSDGVPELVAAAAARLVAAGLKLPLDGGHPPSGAWRDYHQLAYVAIWQFGPITNFVATELHQPNLLRDIFRYPHITGPAFDARWRTETVVALAREIDAHAAYDRLPILADALLDVGCALPDLLQRCRCGGPHVRGCWPIDLVLNRD